MTLPNKPTKRGRSAAAKVSGADAQRVERRRQLFAEECARQGVRFLPAQVMRTIYEREGVL